MKPIKIQEIEECCGYSLSQDKIRESLIEIMRGEGSWFSCSVPVQDVNALDTVEEYKQAFRLLDDLNWNNSIRRRTGGESLDELREKIGVRLALDIIKNENLEITEEQLLQASQGFYPLTRWQRSAFYFATGKATLYYVDVLTGSFNKAMLQTCFPPGAICREDQIKEILGVQDLGLVHVYTHSGSCFEVNDRGLVGKETPAGVCKGAEWRASPYSQY